MSRKNRDKEQGDRSEWNVPQVYAFHAGFGPFKVRNQQPIQDALLLLKHRDDETTCSAGRRHAMWSAAAQVQEIVLRGEERASPFDTVIVLDIRSMMTQAKEERSGGNTKKKKNRSHKSSSPDRVCDVNEMLQREADEPGLSKTCGKAILRLLDRMRCQNVTLAAEGDACPLLFKLDMALNQKGDSCLSALWLLHPNLPTKFVNHSLSNSSPDNRIAVHVTFENAAAKDKRLDVLRHAFPRGVTKTWKASNTCLVASLLELSDNEDGEILIPEYDRDFCDHLGKSLFLSKVTVEMSAQTKQYERILDDITTELSMVVRPKYEAEAGAIANMDWSNCPQEVGALVLRGNRCILVRSLDQEWTGMRLPSVTPAPTESPTETAIRSFVELCDVDPEEVMPLPHILPVAVYAPDDRPVMVTLYPLYATSPPPDEVVEDEEDDDSPYDWYTFVNASKRLDERSKEALSTMAQALRQASHVSLLPDKWGGIFGQEERRS